MGTGGIFTDMLLLAVVGLLSYACFILRRNTAPSAVSRALQELDAAVRQHVQVNAVLALAEQFQDRPELLDHVAGYAQQTVAAALLHRVNMLAAAHESLERSLSQALQLQFSSIGALTKASNDALARLQAAQATLSTFNRSINTNS